MHQKSPTKLPTTTRLLTGTIVRFSRDTRGQSFKPDVASGQNPCTPLSAVFLFWTLDILKHTLWQSRIMAFPSLPLKALITAMNSNVLTVAPNVWSKANFLAVLVLLNLFFPSKSVVYAGNCSSRYSCHRTLGGQLRKLNNTKCMIGIMSRTK